jgi:hypothetical protein
VSTRLYFDLQAVTERAEHAILADRNAPTQRELDLRVPVQPALWFYRAEGRIRLCSNGVRPSYDIRDGSRLSVNAEEGPLPTPAVRPPDVCGAKAIALLASDGTSLYDLLRAGVVAHRQWAMLDPQTLTIGVGNRRLRKRTRADADVSAGSDLAEVAAR